MNCEFCGQIGVKETAEDVEIAKRKERIETGENKSPISYSDPTKLTWLNPDEMWICNRCLRDRIRKITIV